MVAYCAERRPERVSFAMVLLADYSGLFEVNIVGSNGFHERISQERTSPKGNPSA